MKVLFLASALALSSVSAFAQSGMSSSQLDDLTVAYLNETGQLRSQLGSTQAALNTLKKQNAELDKKIADLSEKLKNSTAPLSDKK